MTSPPHLPDRLRPPLEPPTRALVDELAHRAPAWAWRGLNPLAREPFDDGGAPAVAPCLDVETADGWNLPCRVVPPRPGAAGEPVVLLHTLGLGASAFRYGREGTLVDRLLARGFSVYLPTLRGDGEATAPRRRARVDFDAVAGFDVPAILRAVAAHAGARRVLVLGHGLGGLAALAGMAVHGDDLVAGFVALSVPVRFPALSPVARAGLALVAHGPSRTLPVRPLARFAAVCTPPGPSWRPGVPAAGSRLRGGLLHAAEDVPAGLLEQLITWCREGALVDGGGVREYGCALADVAAPALVVTSTADTWAPPERTAPLRGLWGGPCDLLDLQGDAAMGHLELVLHPDADRHVFRPVVERVGAWRSRCWAAAESIAV